MKKHLLCLLLATGVLTSFFSFTAIDHRDNVIQIQVCKQTEQAIRLSPNPTLDGTLSVVSESKAVLHFYVFDVEGTMLYHAQLAPGAKETIGALKKGVYSYDVFRQDEGVEQGKITVL